MNKLITFCAFVLLFSTKIHSFERETGGRVIPMQTLYECRLTNALSGPDVSITSDKFQSFFAVDTQISNNMHERHRLNLVSTNSNENSYEAEHITVVIEKNGKRTAEISFSDTGLTYDCSLFDLP